MMKYYVFDNDTPIPARWNEGAKESPQIWSNGWVNYPDPWKWWHYVTRIKKAEFDALCAKVGAKEDDPVRNYGQS